MIRHRPGKCPACRGTGMRRRSLCRCLVCGMSGTIVVRFVPAPGRSPNVQHSLLSASKPGAGVSCESTP
jgi:RecJ-like exonuclease